ncbi:hypothetical protein PS645_04994 [Pseudomonas fluorescens]|uniref:Uncharacterized protein n=2 Tax=Pseudomonas fluorescens TaxID=294 RepID=A0A5E6X0G6_PSEFL|nr:hypothetical protein PS645_04994 [Pseudomonas fluorescens]
MFERRVTLQAFESVAVKRILAVSVVLVLTATTTYGLFHWKSVGTQTQQSLCGEARQTLKGVEVQARALAAGLTVDDYVKAEEDDVATLIRALDAAANETEVDRAIEAHAASIEAKNAVIDAEVDTRGDQIFLEQRLKKQRIPIDVKQQLLRAAKAVSVSCT